MSNNNRLVVRLRAMSRFPVCTEAADALEAAQAEVASLTQDRDEWKESTVMANENQRRSDAKAHAMQEERDAALARLAEVEAQESVATVLLHEGEKIIDGTMAFMDTAWLGMPLFAAAGASPVQPSQALEFNKAINFAIEQGVGAGIDFLVAWREGDTSEWPEFAAINAKGGTNAS